MRIVVSRQYPGTPMGERDWRYTACPIAPVCLVGECQIPAITRPSVLERNATPANLVTRP